MTYPAANVANHAVQNDELDKNCPLCQADIVANMADGPMKLHPCGHLMHAHCQGQNDGFQVSNCPQCNVKVDDFFSLSNDNGTWEYDG